MAGGQTTNIYGFIPLIAPAVVFIVLFFITTSVHIWQVQRSKAYYYWVFCVGGIFEVIGYIMRVISRGSPGNVLLYVLQTLFILLPPIFFAASIYMTLGRLLNRLGSPEVSPVRIKWMTKIFLAGDIMSLSIQGAGGGVQTSNVKLQGTGSDIVIGGLVIQLISFIAFLLTAILCHRRLNRKLHEGRMDPNVAKYNWQLIFYILYVGSVLILVRSFFRVVEFAEGYHGFLILHEVFMYVFDASLMFIMMAIFNVVHPGARLMEINGGEEVVGDEVGPVTDFEGYELHGDEVNLTSHGK